MQNIHVKRYSQPDAVGYSGAIEPEDRSWILFVPADGSTPQLWQRSERPDDSEPGVIISGFEPA